MSKTVIVSGQRARDGEVPDGYIITDRVSDRDEYYAEPDDTTGDLRARFRRIQREATAALKLMKDL